MTDKLIIQNLQQTLANLPTDSASSREVLKVIVMLKLKNLDNK